MWCLPRCILLKLILQFFVKASNFTTFDIFFFQGWNSFSCWRKQNSCGGDTEGIEWSWVESISSLEIHAHWIFRGLTILSCCSQWKNNTESLWLDISQGNSMEIGGSTIFIPMFFPTWIRNLRRVNLYKNQTWKFGKKKLVVLRNP